TSPARYEADLAGRLVAKKYRDAIESTVNVSDAELLSDFMVEQDKADLNFVALNDSDVAIKEPTVKEIADFEAKSADVIEARYKRDESKYHEPRRLKARHILLKVGETASEDDAKKVEKKIQGILAEAQKPGADFSALAKQHSDDSSKERGGDLG